MRFSRATAPQPTNATRSFEEDELNGANVWKVLSLLSGRAIVQPGSSCSTANRDTTASAARLALAGGQANAFACSFGRLEKMFCFVPSTHPLSAPLIPATFFDRSLPTNGPARIHANGLWPTHTDIQK